MSMQEQILAVGRIVAATLQKQYGLEVAPVYHEAMGQAAITAVQSVLPQPHRSPDSGEALEADPMAYRCPECGAIKPPMGVSYTQAEVPGMGELIYATLFCGKCRVILNTQILELQSATLAAQKAGFAPPNASKLWTPGGRGN